MFFWGRKINTETIWHFDRIETNQKYCWFESWFIKKIKRIWTKWKFCWGNHWRTCVTWNLGASYKRDLIKTNRHEDNQLIKADNNKSAKENNKLRRIKKWFENCRLGLACTTLNLRRRNWGWVEVKTTKISNKEAYFLGIDRQTKV